MFVSRNDAAEVRKIDLLTYMETCEPNNLRRICAGNYRLVEHDSVVISNGLWCQKSTGIGGRSALDYLIKVRQLSFPDAVSQVLGRTYLPRSEKNTNQAPKLLPFTLPIACKNANRATQYLRSRGISYSVINHFIKNGSLYESQQHHNVVFVGHDYQSDSPKYAMMRGCGTSFKGECAGSDKRYGFRLDTESAVVHVFEAAIDLISYATMKELCNKDWKSESLLSLGGIATQKQLKLPIALEEFLKHNPQINSVILHLDNDEKGIQVANQIQEFFQDTHINSCIMTCAHGKDVNDELNWELQNSPQKQIV